MTFLQFSPFKCMATYVDLPCIVITMVPTSYTLFHKIWLLVMRSPRRSLNSMVIQVNLIITLSLGSMETDHVISEPCYNEVIYNRHIAK